MSSLLEMSDLLKAIKELKARVDLLEKRQQQAETKIDKVVNPHCYYD